MVALAAELVPCQGAVDCNLCTFDQLIQNIINFAIGLSIPLAAIMFSYAGWLYFSNRENTSQIEKAHKIFTSVLIGFCIAIAGWLIVQTVLKTLAPGYQSWTTFSCIGLVRPMDKNIGQLFQQSGVQKSTITPATNSASYGCQSGTAGTDGYCYNAQGQLTGAPTLQQSSSNSLVCPDNAGSDLRVVSGKCLDENDNVVSDAVLSAPSQTGKGDCSPGALSNAWGNNAAAMSCIAQRESSCDPGRASQSDVTADNRSFSWGMYQINISVNPVSCPNGQKLNCPQAFNGKNYKATVADQELYAQCVSAAQNIECNTYTAQQLLNNTPNGIRNWSTAGACGY